MPFSLARLNALALGWAINLIVVVKFEDYGGKYAFLALCAALVASILAVYKFQRASVVGFVVSLLVTAFAAFCAVFDVMTH